MGPLVPPQAVRSVYRAIARHCLRLNDDGLKILADTKAQFLRRRKAAKIGHVRAAYNLEASLRDVCLGRVTLNNLRQKFTTKQVPKMENNAEARYFLWRQHESRRLDNYNSAPMIANTREEVTRRSRIANMRARYLHARSLKGHNVAAVDTVFAPYWYKIGHYKHAKEDSDRRSRPRKVEIKSITRVGGELSLLRIQGIRLVPHGFRRHIKQLNNDWGKTYSEITRQLDVANDYLLEDPSWKPWVVFLKSWRRDFVRKQREYNMGLQVHRQILTRRQQELQRVYNWQHRRKELSVGQPLRLKKI